jgi:hypothetical protein
MEVKPGTERIASFSCFIPLWVEDGTAPTEAARAIGHSSFISPQTPPGSISTPSIAAPNACLTVCRHSLASFVSLTRLRALAPAPRHASPQNVKRNRFGISIGKNTTNEEGRMKNAEGKMEAGAMAEVVQYQPVTRCDPQ